MNPCPKTKTPRIKPRRVRDPKHLARVAELPCCVCGSSPVEVHHIRVHGGTGRKAGDHETIPLCPFHHRTGGIREAFHAGPRAWEATYGTQLDHLARTLDKLRGVA